MFKACSFCTREHRGFFKYGSQLGVITILGLKGIKRIIGIWVRSGLENCRATMFTTIHDELMFRCVEQTISKNINT